VLLRQRYQWLTASEGNAHPLYSSPSTSQGSVLGLLPRRKGSKLQQQDKCISLLAMGTEAR
jgi:hypothetical protein